MARSIYILLTRSNTFMSQAIYRMTRDEFTHVSLSLDDHLTTMYSFCRRYPSLPVPAGFAMETLYHGFYGQRTGISCRLYSLTVSDEDYLRLQMALALLTERSQELKYDIVGTMLCHFEITHQRYNHRYCSWFIAELLGRLHILEFSKEYSLVRPMDFTEMEELHLLYSGTIGNLATQLVSA